MSKFDWSKFDKTVDVEGLKEDIQKASENDFEELPDGKYEVVVTDMVLGQSKKKENGKGGDPMLKITFEVIEGKYEKRLIFYNGVMNLGSEHLAFQIHNQLTMLRGLTDDESIEWASWSNFAEAIEDIFEDIADEEYLLEKQTNKKGFQTYKILEIFGD